MKNKIFDKKTLKYGSASVILAVFFIALIFILNLVVTSFTEKLGLYVDLTEEQLYEISDATDTLIKDVMDEEIKFIFFTPLDELDENTYLKSVKTLALEYEAKYDNVKIEYIDMLKNPSAVAKYRRDYNLSATTIVVESSRRHTAFDMSECFVYTDDGSGNYQYFAFNGEYRFTSSIIKVTRKENPRALFVTNHSETVPVQLRALLADAGFSVENIDLSQNAIPDDTKLVIINAPLTDFTGIESEDNGISEITKLSRYLESGGNVMLFVNPDTKKLSNLDELCRNWGVGINYGHHVVDEVNSVASMDSLALITRYVDEKVSEEEKDLTKFHKRLSGAESPIKTVSYYTVPLEILPITDISHSAGAILASYATSSVPETDIKGVSVPVLVGASRRSFNEETAETDVNYLIVGGSTYFAGDVFLGTYRNTYGNVEIINSIISEITDETMILDVNYKIYNDTTLTLDKKTMNDWFIILVTVLPAAVLLAAFIVFIKRRHL